MRVEGVQYTCTRCGKKEFIAWTPLHHKYPDHEVGEWVAIDSDTHLCPECGEVYRNGLAAFLRTTGKTV